MVYIGKNKDQLTKQSTKQLKEEVEKDAWISLKQYFDGRGNGVEAKIACVVIGTLARHEQATNNARQLDLIEKRLLPTK